MKHYEKLTKACAKTFQEVESIGVQKRIAIALSGRVELLEKFISENTEYDGEKVGFKNKEIK